MKRLFNENKRCPNCKGILGESIGQRLTSPLVSHIEKDKIVYKWREVDEKTKKLKTEIVKRVNINFCPYCGCQLRKKVDWNLCD